MKKPWLLSGFLFKLLKENFSVNDECGGDDYV